MKISYVKRWNPEDGTCYTQNIKVDALTFGVLKDAIQSEIALGYPRRSEYVSTSGGEIYLTPIRNTKGVCFMNTTQTRFVNLWLKANISYSRNTCLRIAI